MEGKVQIEDIPLVLVLRGINAFKRIEQVIPRPDLKSSHMDYLMTLNLVVEHIVH
jgi:hypothetical protein